jgi:DNA modification methylase
VTAVVHQGTVFDVLPTIQAGSVDCAVCSPPYWQLRSYLPKGHALKPLELGSEPTPGEYVANMVRVFALVRTALADHGTVWLNIGDTYASCRGDVHDSPKSSGGQAMPKTDKVVVWGNDRHSNFSWELPGGIGPGNLCLIPQRLALALQADGWIVRSVVVWHKPAPMPSSVSGWAWRRCRVKVKAGWTKETHPSVNGVCGDIKAGTTSEAPKAQWSDCPGCKRCTATGGYVLRKGSWRPTSAWEPVLMLAKSPGYFCDAIAVQQPAAAATISRNEYTRILDDPDEQFAVRHDHETELTTANPRDVWTIGAEPLREKHYAAFPTELVRRCLLAGTSSKGYCPACGMPWVRMIQATPVPHPGPRSAEAAQARDDGAGLARGGNQSNGSASLGPDIKTLGWRPSCNCPGELPPRPGLVLDPFCGSGRTGLTAQQLGLDFVGCELNPDYAEMSRRLLYEASPLFS